MHQHNQQPRPTMADAPGLLATLEMMVRAFNTSEVDPLVAFVAIEKARAVIAAAKGE